MFSIENLTTVVGDGARCLFNKQLLCPIQINEYKLIYHLST